MNDIYKHKPIGENLKPNHPTKLSKKKGILEEFIKEFHHYSEDELSHEALEHFEYWLKTSGAIEHHVNAKKKKLLMKLERRASKEQPCLNCGIMFQILGELENIKRSKP